MGLLPYLCVFSISVWLSIFSFLFVFMLMYVDSMPCGFQPFVPLFFPSMQK